MPTASTLSPVPVARAICAAALLLGSGSAAAQPAVPQEPGSLRTMVRGLPLPIPTYAHADDVREQAWRAWIAGRDGIDAAQPALERLVAERIDVDPWHPLVDYALDALIQLRVGLQPDLLARIIDERRVEGLILLSQVDDGTADGVLLSALGRARSHEWFAAANMMVSRRPAGAVAHLLAGLRIEARITVSASGDVVSGGGSGGSIGCGVAAHHPGMPPWPSYRLTSDGASGDVVLALGPTPVYYQRRVAAAGSGPSRSGTEVEAPTAADRLRYVAASTGRQPGLSDSLHRSVRRSPTLDTGAVAAEMRRDIERRHARFVRDLVEAGFVSVAEAETLTVEIEVVVVEAGADLARP
jgi:hypothetical protein